MNGMTDILTRSSATKLNRKRGMSVFVVCSMFLGMAAAFAAPELNVVKPEKPAHPGHAYRILCEVSWSGDASEYSISPAEADPIDWGTVALTEMKAFVRKDAEGSKNIVSQIIEITPNKFGDFKTPAIRIAYFTPEATPPAESAAPQAAAPVTVPPDSSASPSLRADPFDFTVYPDRSSIWFFGGLGASLFLVVLCGFFFMRSRKGLVPLDAARAKQGESILSKIEAARKRASARRLEGDFYQYYLELAAAASELPESGETPDLASTLRTRAQEVGYKGARPTEDQMDGDARELERAVARYKETLQS
jgi:hypothetical protein